MRDSHFKIGDLKPENAIHELIIGVSPEVMRAQRMAELEQMAKYRALKLEQYQEWSKDPIAYQKKVLGEEEFNRLVNEAAANMKKMKELPKSKWLGFDGAKLPSRKEEDNKFLKGLKIKEIFKPASVRLTWFERLLAFLKRFLG